MAHVPRQASSDASRRGGPTPLAATFQKILAEAGRSRRGGHQRVFDAWNQAVGTELAKHAVPLGFRRGELRIQVDSSARLHELQGFTAEQHRAEVNRILGEPAIRKLAFKLAGR
jgi:hypothetical protein